MQKKLTYHTPKMPIAMTHIDLQKLINIDHLVHIRRTGTPAEFARKVGLSRSTLFEYIAYLRDELQVGIAYNRYETTYYYDGADLLSALNRMLGRQRDQNRYVTPTRMLKPCVDAHPATSAL